VYPQRIPDLFSARPVVVTGRYTGPGRATIRMKGKLAGNDFVREIPIELPETMASHDVLASLWARARVDDLMGQDISPDEMREDLKDTITQLGIEYRLLTKFTSFVAVEETVVTDGGQPRRIDVPVESPEGMSMDAETNGSVAQFFVGRRKLSMTMNGGYLMSAGKSAGSGPSGTLGRPVIVSPPQAAARPMPTPSKGLAVNGAVVVSSVTASDPKPLTEADTAKAAEENRRAELNRKLHRSVLAVVERLRKQEALTSADEAGFIRNGKAEVQVWVSEKSEANLAKLKELGFEVVLDTSNSRLIIGRLSVDKLEALAELKFVTYVSPQVSK
jgi:Ca-activated chloride channel family protein